ncbi:MAG: AMP-binding protein [Halieaceae bacterium]|nr:AMP-binding protein [Halieaceae bacterium]
MTEPAAPGDRLQQLLAAQAARRPGGIALWWRGVPTTYAALYERVRALAARLAASGAVGDRVAVLAWNCPEFVELIYAVPASGRVLVPLNARLAPAELAYQLQAAGVSTLFGDPELLQPLRQQGLAADMVVIDLEVGYPQWLAGGPTAPLPATDPGDPVWILYTSGSTGRPKGAVLTHESFMAGLRSAALGRPVVPGDKYLYPFPLFHVAAHNVLLQHQYGAAVVLTRSFDAAATLETCRELQVTTMSLAPTMIAMLLEHPDFSPCDLQSVRTIGYGASAMPESLLRRLLAETDVGLCQSYGMTELSGSAAFLTVEDHQLAADTRPELLQSVGRPLPTVEIRLVGEDGRSCATGERGEILVRARQCMRGYWNQPEATALAIIDGWLHTGDIGRFDAGGYLYIVDRKKDMIISGGENVASREVEEVMRRHPAVKDCAVIGLPDPRWGETICCVLQLQTEVSDAELVDHCRRFLAGYKTPRRWVRAASLPLNAAGKVDKPALRLAHAVPG